MIACAPAYGETRVYLLRGWFGVFSTGLDGMAEELRKQGIQAEAIGHVAWKSTVAKVVTQRASGQAGRLVLVGHSQGGNNIIDMARELQAHKVTVDLLITLSPYLQDPVPANVARAVNYYQAGGWGTPLTADRGFTGELKNIDVGGDAGVFHINIDKNERVQAEVLKMIAALR
ncbi:MAG TPA: lipase [Casimicrobiaceae bacterium]|nr:lipase [Casimicrobiaceae bacterium]